MGGIVNTNKPIMQVLKGVINKVSIYSERVGDLIIFRPGITPPPTRISSKIKKPAVYFIKCIENNMLYIGSCLNAPKRVAWHKSQLRADKHDAKSMQGDFNLYGENSFLFGIIKYFSEYKIAKLEESKLIRKYKASKCLYNRYS